MAAAAGTIALTVGRSYEYVPRRVPYRSTVLGTKLRHIVLLDIGKDFYLTLYMKKGEKKSMRLSSLFLSIF